MKLVVRFRVRMGSVGELSPFQRGVMVSPLHFLFFVHRELGKLIHVNKALVVFHKILIFSKRKREYLFIHSSGKRVIEEYVLAKFQNISISIFPIERASDSRILITHGTWANSRMMSV